MHRSNITYAEAYAAWWAVEQQYRALAQLESLTREERAEKERAWRESVRLHRRFVAVRDRVMPRPEKPKVGEAP